MAERYLMEDEREAQRLADKVDAAAWVRTYLEPLLRSGMRVLDVGCGPGTIAAAAARSYPDIEVVALDASPSRLAVAARDLDEVPNARTELGDASALPFPDQSFDLVYSRFLFEYLPDKEQAVSELARVCDSGGIVLLQDLDAQLVSHYPPDPAFELGLAAALVMLQSTGFDPHVGRKLFHLLRGAGLTGGLVAAGQYHLIAGTIAEQERALWVTKLEIAAAALEEFGFRDATTVKARFLAYLDRDDTISFSTLFTAWARKS